MSQLTVRGVTLELNHRLVQLSRAHGQSVNAFVLDLLKKTTGIDERKARLRRYATWSSKDLEEFQGFLSMQRTIDERLWQ